MVFYDDDRTGIKEEATVKREDSLRPPSFPGQHSILNLLSYRLLNTQSVRLQARTSSSLSDSAGVAIASAS